MAKEVRWQVISKGVSKEHRKGSEKEDTVAKGVARDCGDEE